MFLHNHGNNNKNIHSYKNITNTYKNTLNMKLNEKLEKKLQKIAIETLKLKLEIKKQLKHNGIDIDKGDNNTIYNRITDAQNNLLKAIEKNSQKIQ